MIHHTAFEIFIYLFIFMNPTISRKRAAVIKPVTFQVLTTYRGILNSPRRIGRATEWKSKVFFV